MEPKMTFVDYSSFRRFLLGCYHISVGGWKFTRLHRRLHGPDAAESGKPIHRVTSYLRFVRRLFGDGLRRGQRPAGILDFR